MIFSWGANFANGDITYHGPNNRSARSLPLISSLNKVITLNMDEVDITDFRVNVICYYLQKKNEFLF